jgi:hypothetical protein
VEGLIQALDAGSDVTLTSGLGLLEISGFVEAGDQMLLTGAEAGSLSDVSVLLTKLAFNTRKLSVLDENDNPVDFTIDELGEQMVNAQFHGLFEFAHQHQAVPRGSHHLERTGFAVAPGVLAGMVDIELVVGMLHHRYPEPTQLHRRNELLDQGGLARARKTREGNDLHESAQC